MTNKQISITNKVKANVDLEALANMAFRIESSSNISLFEVEKTLKGLLRDLQQNEQASNSLEYALRQLQMARNTISTIDNFYQIEEARLN